MAELIYGAEGDPVHMPEHLLAHVKLVVATKLRRNESFMMTWRHPDGSGRSSVWLEPSIPLRFVFESIEEPAIDHALLASLAAAASSNGGLILDLADMHLLAASGDAPPRPEKAPAEVAQPAA
ncbi:hypothetical protein [Microbacterium sp. ProA8]|jgi:hypothetical protein|uniref:DUF7882 family protein n=1 Tax=Microbacterium chionoecetis TaxID=3153754 RepID=UPI0032648404